jgi:hypothetical protein
MRPPSRPSDESDDSKEHIVDTARLSALQRQPSQVDTLLESFVLSRSHIPVGTWRIFERSDLPGSLQRVAIRAQKVQHTWGAWTDDRHLWFYTAEMSLPLSRERGQPVLQINSYNEEGQIEESALWVSIRDGRWERCWI